MSDKMEYDKFNSGQELLNVLFENECITESFFRSNTATTRILSEGAQGDDLWMYSPGNIPIDRARFTREYTDKGNATPSAVFIRLQIPESTVSSKEPNTLLRELSRIRTHFNSSAAEGDIFLLPWKDRDQSYEIGSDGEEIEEQEPTTRDILFGDRSRKNQSTRVMDKINKQELVDGEFYSNITRIPKRNWQHWLKFWDRERTETGKDTKNLKTWRKSFVLGYQLTQNAVVEIWYNAMDSTFTVHDQNGVNIGRHRSPSLNEAIKRMFNYIASISKADADFFTMRNPLSMSAARSIGQSLDKDVLRDLADKADNEERVRGMSKAERERFEIDKKRSDLEMKKLIAQEKQEYTELEKAEKERIRKEKEELGIGAINKIKKAVKDGTSHISRYSDDPVEDKRIRDMSPTERARFMDEREKERVKDLKDREAEEARLKKIQDRKDKKFRDKEAKTATSRTDRAKEIGKSIRAGVKSIHDYSMGADTDIEDFYKEREKELKDKAVPKDIRNDPETKKRIRELEARMKKERQAMLDDIPAFGKKRTVKESMDDILPLDVDTMSRGYDTVVRNVKNSATTMTLQMIKATVMGEQIQMYYESRVKSYPNIFFERVGNVLSRFLARSERPGSRPIWDRVKSALKGEYFRADFVMGFTLNNAVDIEIWYVTEPNPNYVQGDEYQVESIASYYVYDVTAEKIIRKYIPYYRNAVQTVLQKIGTFGE